MLLACRIATDPQKWWSCTSIYNGATSARRSTANSMLMWIQMHLLLNRMHSIRTIHWNIDYENTKIVLWILSALWAKDSSLDNKVQKKWLLILLERLVSALDSNCILSWTLEYVGFWFWIPFKLLSTITNYTSTEFPSYYVEKNFIGHKNRYRREVLEKLLKTLM